MVGRQIHENEKRVLAPLAFDDLQGMIVEEPIGLQSARAHVLGVDKMRDAGRFVETAGTEESARPRIKGVGLVAATGERAREAALDPAGGDPGDEISEASEGFRGKAGENIVFGVPTRTADAFDRERSDPAIERLEMPAIVGGNPDPGTAVMSKLDSSCTMMMCGRLPAAWQVLPIVGSSRSAFTASDSMNPCVINSEIATTPDRTKLET
jgi:hypothetical protein